MLRLAVRHGRLFLLLLLFYFSRIMNKMMGAFCSLWRNLAHLSANPRRPSFVDIGFPLSVFWLLVLPGSLFVKIWPSIVGNGNVEFAILACSITLIMRDPENGFTESQYRVVSVQLKIELRNFKYF
jgi:hypothetical protein